MKRIAILAGCALLGIGGQVAAACTVGTRVQDLNGTSGGSGNGLLGDKTVCGTGINASAGDKWQEWHQTGGTLTEYALGSNPVDPTHNVGSWSVASNNTATATVTHNYGSGGSFTWSVHDNGSGSYSFCTGTSGTELVTATLLSGQQSCGF